MSESTKIEGLVKTAMDKVREMADCETVVGKPIVTADGTTIIPVSKISVGFASGGSDLPTKSTKETFGGGSGGGVTIQPIAFIAVYKGEAKLLQLSMNATKENAIINMVPEVIDKITDFLGRKSDDEDEHEHHHHHHHHHGHDADEVFISWGEETHRKFTKAEIEHILQALEDAETYGIILRAKGYVANAEGEKWIHFDYVPGEPDIRDGGAMVTGRICVIGSKLNEEAVAKLFGVEKQ